MGDRGNAGLQPGRLGRLAWLPIPLFAVALIGLRAADLRGQYESADLLLLLNFIFSVLVSLFIAYLVGRSFLVRSTPGLLLLGCGVLIWGAAGFVGIAAGLVFEGGRWDINVLIAVHNTCAWVSGLCHLAGVGLSLRPRRPLQSAGAWLAGGYALALGAVALVVVAALSGWMPVFFVQGRGGTLLRDLVLGSAAGMFALTALVLQLANRRAASAFAYWYSLALGLIAVGLFGIMIESVHGGILSWTGRAPQFLSGVYLLAAAVASARETHAWRIPLEAALQRERDLNAALLSTVGAVVTVLDLEGRVVRFNRACEQLTGYTLQEVEGRPFWDFLILPEERAGVQQTFAALRAGDFPIEYENYWVEKDGGRHLLHWSNTVLTDAAGNVEYVIGTGLDITARRRAEEALRESERRWATTLASIGDAVIATDATGVVTFLNPAAEALTGWTQADAAGRAVTEVFRIVNEQSHQEVESPVARVLREGVVVGLANHTLLVRKDGAELPVDDSGAPIRDETGRVVGVVLVFRDVSERRQAEAALARSERSLVEAQRLARIGDWEWDIGTGEVRWSAGIHAIYGTDPDTFAPDINAFAEYVHPDDRELMREVMGQLVSTGRPISFDFRIVLADGSVRVVNTVGEVTALDADGKPSVVVGTNQDVTERKQAEEALRESEERYRNLVRYAPAAIYEMNPQGTQLLSVNDTMCDLLRYSREELLSIPPADLLDPESRARFGDRVRRKLAGEGIEETAEYRIRRKDGEWIYAAVNVGAFSRTHEGPPRVSVIAHDITARKQAEEALQTSLQRFHTVLSSMYAAILLVTDEGRVEFANQAFSDFYGLEVAPTELAGLTSAETIEMVSKAYLHPEEEIARIRELVGRVEPVRNEEIAMRDGRTCLRDFIPIRIGGTSYGRLWQHLDISERKRAEESLRLANDRLGMAQRAAGAGVWDWDIATGHLEWSRELFALFGLDPEQTASTFVAWEEALHPEDREGARARIDDALRQHTPLDSEYRVVPPDGTVRWVNALGQGVYDDRGAPVRMSGICIDITARKQAEEDRAQLHAEVDRQGRLLDTIVTATDDRLAYLDRDLRYVRVNAAYAASARMAPEEFVGRHRLEVFPNAPEVAAMYRHVLATGEPDSIAEYTGVPRYRPEAGVRTVRIDAVPVRNESGEVEGLVTSMSDITDHVWQRQRLVEAERARTELAEVLGREIAHRTKNNLAIVAGLLQLQLETDSAPDSHADLIRDAVTRIMSFAALHEQMYQRHSEAVELLDALRRIVEVDRQALSAGEVEISVEGEPADYPSSVATNLCVVANELVTNAIKHGSTPGRAHRIEVRLSREAGRLVLSVWNSNNPVPADFDVRKGSRTGLGLVRSIMEDQYGGSFALVPDRGGTLARITLDEERLLPR